MKRPTFNPEITAGHLVQLAGMLLTVAVLYANARVDRALMAERIEQSEKKITAIVTQNDKQDETLHLIAVTVAKMEERLPEKRAWPESLLPKTGKN